MAEPRPAHGERRRELHGLVVLARQLREPPRDVHVGGSEHAGLVELAQQARGADHQPRVGHVPRSRTSLSASTSAPDGRHANTPQPGGVSGPTIPRRNR